MTHHVFGGLYASLYDLLYFDKDYESECNLLEEVFRGHASQPVRTILDLGCGTGNHAWPLAQRGYRVTGVDRSPEMLVKAQEKAASQIPVPASQHPIFHQGDVRQVNLERQFDAVLMMFNVLGYQLSNEDVASTLRAARRHLKPGGLLVADVWYGPAVLKMGTEKRVKEIAGGGGKIIRTASASVDYFQHLAEVYYKVTWLKDIGVPQETEESHRVRYFFPQELAFFLDQNQLAVVRMSAFGNLTRDVTPDDWNMLVVGRAA